MRTFEKEVYALMRMCAAEKESDRRKAWREVRLMLEQGPQAIISDPEPLVRQILLELGAPDHLLGHPYVVYAILLVGQERLYIDSITTKLYPKVAARFETTPARVERAIRHLIEVTWSRGDLDVLGRYFGNTVNPQRGKPTNGEFIARIASELQSHRQAA